MSDRDIPTGELWATQIASHLASSDFGIICLTPENLSESWILFEAGALSKQFDRSRVVPYLHELTPTDVRPPLALFQGATADERGTRRLLEGIQDSLGTARVDQEILDDTFKFFWPNMEETLNSLPPVPVATPPPQRTEADMLEELLLLARGSAKTEPILTYSRVSPRLGDEVFIELGKYEGLRGMVEATDVTFRIPGPGNSFFSACVIRLSDGRSVSVSKDYLIPIIHTTGIQAPLSGNVASSRDEN